MYIRLEFGLSTDYVSWVPLNAMEVQISKSERAYTTLGIQVRITVRVRGLWLGLGLGLGSEL